MRSIYCCAAAGALLLLALLSQTSGQNNPNIVSDDPRSPADEKKCFRLPPGFEAQLVAAEPDIHKPLNIAFDDRGRLWVSETVEYPFAAPPGRKPRDAVKILEDFGPDGRARKVTTFADGLNIPIGVLPLPGAQPREAIVYSIPNIWKLRDSRGTGQADQREVLYKEFGTRDTHGMTNAFNLGFDGWIYATHGYSNTSTVKGADNKAITMQSGNTYRMKADGSHIEWFTHGQVNPFGLAFDPLGNLYSADCHTQPIYQLLRGAYYPSFGKPHDGLGFGPEMLTEYRDSTAIAGIVYYAADHFPASYLDTAFIGDVVTNNIVQFRLTWHGSTPKAQLHYFLKSEDHWFRPVDIKLGPDGALYVADFYNRIIGHYEVPLTHPGRDRERGRIWRIVYTGPDGKNKPQAPRTDWTTASVEELVQDLGHANLTVRLMATNQLVHRGGSKVVEAVRAVVVPAGKEDDQARTWRRAHGMWVLERTGGLEDATLVQLAADPTVVVRVHVQRILAERRALPEGLRKLAFAGLKDADPNVQRAAADTLGRHPAVENLRPLLALRHQIPSADTHLRHVVRMALRDQLLAADTWAKLPLEPWSERDAKSVADVSLGVPSAEAAAYLLQHIQRIPEGREMLLNAVHHIARHGTPEVNHSLLLFVQQHHPDNLLLQAALFRSIEKGTQERGVSLPESARSWGSQLTERLLSARGNAEVQAGIELVGALRLEAQQTRLIQLATTRTTPEPQRNSALTALAAIDARRHALVLGQVLTDAESPIGLRENAAALLARANQAETRAQLLQALPAAPARLQTVIAAWLAGTRQGAEKLLEAVAAGKASARLLQERFVEVRLQESHLPDLKTRVGKLTQGLPPADQRLQELLNRRRDGFRAAKADAVLGLKVYEKSCANCHQIGGKGAKIGPQLDGIGIRGLERLLEDTLDPNRNVDQAFRSTLLTLKNGQVVSGLLLKEEGEVLVLADAQGKEVRVPKGQVEERSTSQQSPMPANFADQIPEPDFYHLLAYLLSQRADKKP